MLVFAGAARAQAPAPDATPAPAAPAAPATPPAVTAPAAPAPRVPTIAAVPGSTQLPAVQVNAPRRPLQPRRPHIRAAATTVGKPPTEAEIVGRQITTLDGARTQILTPIGTAPTVLDQAAIQAMPQASNAPLDKVLLQTPGVTQDSAASGSLHIRNEHANVQYRINGIMLPDGVGAFGQIIDTGIVGSLALITGALPAQYGLRTAGVVDIQTKTDAFNNSGVASIYGGSHGTITPSFEYGGTAGNTQYFVSGRYFGSDLGLENPTPNRSAIHDHTDQGKGFVYLSTLIDDTSRLVFIGGTSTSSYQIPNNPGQPVGTSSGGNPFVTYPFNSAQLNERQFENNQFGVLAYQKSINGLDLQLAYFTRYSTVHFMPDVAGDLAFNGVASDVYRRSYVNGLQADASYKLTDSHTLRFGAQVSGEKTLVSNTSAVLPVDADGNTTTDNPFTINDASAKLGWLVSTYLQDEWKITNQLTLNAGLRFDQMYSYTDANQLSPRISLTYKPFDGTTFHAGYARNFTPPSQVLAAPTNLALVNGTTQQPGVGQNDPVLPERSHVFDVGVTQQFGKHLEVGIDAYYKIATDLLDDGQFGAAYVLTAFNYAKGNNIGVELKARYTDGNFTAYANFAAARQMATNVVSNQYLFDPEELAYIAGHYVYTDHSQIISGSAGASYLWNGTRFSADLIYGSGLRSGFANTGSLPFYSQVNLGVSREFMTPAFPKPMTVRFDVVNLFDSVYEIRNGSGIGVFAPQYGPRRGFFVGLSQKL
ncbi:TonB-dependent receptor [Bradyrhizobium sp. U87765 SZCCT0131]|nr:TonB-dependent receptor [Bradyrhizobium sp. U87765 SZCCT0131]MBR1260862.1 TonB-dependent receptor [Bradyrhizobium sp. U87765 SZCCT0134]MBR1303690.1 TonB-dependent receptor [Bradyrhizobium sp. U87765 SZCCT0110]MBR1319296.1 TonB-dependent receptor [Bradyrhizobium sp. U87765 SZCCT0109]MBR1347621.1 TonB-dependent receptor [Bradyrhizobium sp. U87765 SZCCT0048]